MTQSQPPAAGAQASVPPPASFNDMKSTNPNGPIVLFATPAYGGLQPLAVASLVNAMRDLAAHGYRTQPYWSVNCSIITNAREELVGVSLLSRAEWIVMSDNDVGYPADLVRRMIDFGAPMMAAAIPYRTLDMSEIEATGRYYDGVQFNLTPMDREEIKKCETRNGFLKLPKTGGVGAAFMVMNRAVLETMANRYAELATASSPEIRTFALFHQFLDQSRHWGEDTSFMRRWHELGGETWVCMDAQVTHTGPMTIGGNLAKALLEIDDPEAKRTLKGASGHILRDLKKRVEEVRGVAQVPQLAPAQATVPQPSELGLSPVPPAPSLVSGGDAPPGNEAPRPEPPPNGATP